MDSRRHIINPIITVIMETVGTHQDTISRAIHSFLNQEYENALLLILNYHPEPLRLVNVPMGNKRIEVINAEDVYTRHVYQHINNLKQVQTDSWTILDDDDWIDPDHLSQLVSAWNTCTDRDGRPLRMLAAAYHVHYDDKIEIKQFPGWAGCLFERLMPDEVDLCFRVFPPDVMVGSDTWIASNNYFDRRENSERKPTYHWERRGRNHISNHEQNRGDTPSGRFQYALNFWDQKIAARKQKLLPVDLG